jgi:hypothetical protein
MVVSSTKSKTKLKIKRNEITCTKCGLIKSVNINNFFITDNPLYNGFFPACKNCIYEIYNGHISSGVDIRGAVIQICELLDRPYIEDVFYTTYEKEKDSKKLLGLYFKNSAMQQWRRQGVLRFKDSIFSINSSQGQQTIFEDQTRTYNEEWNGRYTQSDISFLNKYFQGLNNDFKIVTTNHKDYAKKIAQASLAVNKAYQDMLDGTSGADKRYKDLQSTFDTLSKSAQFSESQRGANDVSLGCFGVLFEKVENKKWIPTHIPVEKDDYDKLIDYFASINKSIK